MILIEIGRSSTKLPLKLNSGLRGSLEAFYRPLRGTITQEHTMDAIIMVKGNLVELVEANEVFNMALNGWNLIGALYV